MTNSSTRAAKILSDAASLVGGDRARTHGDCVLQHTKVAQMWSAYLSARYGGSPPLTAEDVCHCLTMLKWSRGMSAPFNPDNAIDAVGYEAIAGVCAESERMK